MNIVSFIWPFVVVIAVIVFVHELGHFLFARMFGVKVTDFSIGFGKEIFGFNDKKGTRWKLCLFPLGGYVQFAGDANAASAADSANIEKLSVEEKKHIIHYKAPWQKILISFAGPLFNYILAFFLMFAIFSVKGTPDSKMKIKEVIKGKPAEGVLMEDDMILGLNGKKITSVHQFITAVGGLEDKNNLDLLVGRKGKQLKINIKPDITNGKATIGIMMENKMFYKPASMLQAVLGSFMYLYDMSYMLLDFIKNIITGEQSYKGVGSVVSIAAMSDKIAKEKDLWLFLGFLAMLSLNIGFINLLPLPMLDGGHILFSFIEMLTRRKIPMRLQENFIKLGFLFILFVMVLTISNDIERFNIIDTVKKYFIKQK
tara:strand:- start:4643 stop:5755 length:1113 start_codon:yes stop_codon:yes gene_type:complete